MTWIHGPSLQEYRNQYSGDRFGPLPAPAHLGCAAHEAAHAVVAASLGHRVSQVSIGFDRDQYGWNGSCKHTVGADADEHVRAMEGAIVALAPDAARDYLEGIVGYQAGCSSGDERDLRADFETLKAAKPVELRAFLAGEAHQQLKRHIDTWRRVTYALMRRNTLDAAALAAIDPDLLAKTTPVSEPVRAQRTAATGSSYSNGRHTIETRRLMPDLEYRYGGPITLNEGRR